MTPFKVGQTVTITTIDKGKGPSGYWQVKRSPKSVTWTGRVVGRSVLGEDLWLIKVRGTTYTVPRREIQA